MMKIWTQQYKSIPDQYKLSFFSGHPYYNVKPPAFILPWFFLQQYYENRLKYLAAQKATGGEPYPHKFPVSMSVVEYIDKYGGLNNGEHLEDVTVNLAGIKIGDFCFIYVLSLVVMYVLVISLLSIFCKGASWASVHLLQSSSFMIYMALVLKFKLWLMLGI